MRYRDPALTKKKVLVTGGTGFLGRHLVPMLRGAYREVGLYGSDIAGIERFTERYDIVCHLAAINKAPENGKADTLFKVNCGGTQAVMRYCSRVGARCLFASSAALYRPSRNGRPLSENAKAGPVSLYGMSKLLSEEICKYHARHSNVPVTVGRIFNMYGPGQQPPFVVPYIIEQLSKNRPVVLNTPYAVRDFIFVEDAARLLALLCAHEHRGFKILNIGTGTGTGIYTLTKKIASIMKVKPKISMKDNVRKNRDFVIADVNRINRISKEVPVTAIEDGIRMFLSYRG